MRSRHRNEGNIRAEERRKREDEAPRLRDEIPNLKSLRIEMAEYREGGTIALNQHTKIVIVERAAALFVIPCSERQCDGEHDLTRSLLRNLEASSQEFEGEDECSGVRGGESCRHQLRYKATAVYGA